MNQYTDITVLECNRLHSEEAKTNNNENFALWTNNLQDIVHIEAGDRVSVQGAMVNEKGAGQSQSIEIKGVNLGIQKTFNFTEVQYGNASNYLPTGYDSISCNASSKVVNIRDDTLNFSQSYYQSATGSNYIHLPRKFWYRPNQSSDAQWADDDAELAGMSRHFINFELDRFSFNDMYWVIDVNEAGSQTEGERIMKPRNDNKRYTIMMRDNTYYTRELAEANYENLPLYNGGARDPENGIYRTYKELKEITIPKGFNSPEFIGNEITRQFQKIIQEKIWRFSYNDNDTPSYTETTAVPLYRTIETESYKPFNVGCIFRDINASLNMISNAYDEYMINASETASGWDYLSQYHLIGCDKPDLYETGRLINELFNVFGQNTYTGIRGAQLKESWLNTSNVITLDITYNKDFCDKFKAFIDTQTKYPEIWYYFKSSTNDYSDADNITNSRWLHINRWSNASLTNTETPDEAMLGHSYYIEPDWFPGNRSKILSSLLLPIHYDSSQAETFYPYNGSNNPLIDENKFSYGCISSNASGLVVIRATVNNGVGTPVYTELLSSIDGDDPVPTNIEAGRKIGFDLHFNAPGLLYMMPYSGYSASQTSFKNASSLGNYDVDPIDWWATETIRGYKFANKLYFGATTPTLEWTGTNFALSGLHTPLNKSQDDRSNNILFSADYPDRTSEASGVVYKINPPELMIDWTPDRKPYYKDPIPTDPAALSKLPLNQNLIPWNIYDNSTGIFIGDFNLTETEWKNTLWDLMGFSYNQFNSPTNNRLIKTDNNNVNNLQLVTTNAEIGTADSKIYVQNGFGAPFFNNMIPMTMGFTNLEYESNKKVPYYAPIVQATESIKILAENLPTRMIRGYYTVRSNILSQAPFIGGKVNNTTMPIIGIVDKINGDGDFYFGSESSLEFTVTKPLRLASIVCSIHDPDGSYANCGEQSTVLIKIQKDKRVTFNVAQEILMEEQEKKSK